MRYATGIELGGTFVKYAPVSELDYILTKGKLSVGGRATKEYTPDAIETFIGKIMEKAAEENIEMIKKSAFRYVMLDCTKNIDVLGVPSGNNAGYLGTASLIYKNVI